MSQADAMAGMLASELGKIEESDAAFKAQQQAQQEQMRGVYDDMFKSLAAKMGQGSEPELPDELKEIVTVLQAQPRLVPAVQAFLQEKVAALNKAIDEVLGPVGKPPGSL